MRRVVATAAVLLCTLATSVACSDDEGPDGSGDAPQDVVTIDITFADGTVTPSGERVEVAAEQPIDLVVTADEPGEIHVHSSTEQTFAYGAGTETFKMQIDRPGVVEVESHELEQIIVQLEVS